MTRMLSLLWVLLLLSGMAAAQPSHDRQLKRADLPTYPPVARQARIQGTVKLSFVIRDDGGVSDVKAISGHPMLKAAAVANIESWRFIPNGIRNENVTTEFVFRLSGKDVHSNPKLTVSLDSFRRVEITTDVLLIPDSPIVRDK
jgi:TonB family protein